MRMVCVASHNSLVALHRLNNAGQHDIGLGVPRPQVNSLDICWKMFDIQSQSRALGRDQPVLLRNDREININVRRHS